MNEQEANAGQVTEPSRPKARFHHVAIEARDLDSSVRWYQQFLGCDHTWTLVKFSEVTERRVRGIRRLAEVALGDLRVHLFERHVAAVIGRTVADETVQHVCVTVESPHELALHRERWLELYRADPGSFASPEQPTDVMTDLDGVQSFYVRDINGVELELRYEPTGGA